MGVRTILVCCVVLALVLLADGCTERERNAASAGDEEQAAQSGGAELWARACRRCHKIPAPTSYTAEQWEVVVNHMRIRAGLTVREALKIEEFLKAAN